MLLYLYYTPPTSLPKKLKIFWKVFQQNNSLLKLTQTAKLLILGRVWDSDYKSLFKLFPIGTMQVKCNLITLQSAEEEVGWGPNTPSTPLNPLAHVHTHILWCVDMRTICYCNLIDYIWKSSTRIHPGTCRFKDTATHQNTEAWRISFD